MPKHIPVTENFFLRNMNNYDTNLPAQRSILPNQNHVDIRTFTADSEEKWTIGNFGAQASLSQLPALVFPIKSGYTITESAAIEGGTFPSSTTLYPMTTLFPGHQTTNVNFPAVDLLTEFTKDDFIIFSLPDFPLTHIDVSKSYIEFTSDPSGRFTSGNIASVAFNTSLTTLIEGNSEFRVRRSAFETTGVNLAQITGVRFRILGTSNATVTIAALRLVSTKWAFSTLDYDNWNGRWRNSVPPSRGGIRNLITNPNFNYDSLKSTTPTGWEKYTEENVRKQAPTITTFEIENNKESPALHIKATLPPNAQVGIRTPGTFSNWIPVNPGETLTVLSNQVEIIQEETGIACSLFLHWYSSTGAGLGGAGIVLSQSIGANRPGTFVAPKEAAFVRVEFRIKGMFLIEPIKESKEGTPLKFEIWIDQLALFRGNEKVYGDGDISGWRWTETPGNSPSELLPTKSIFSEQPIIWRAANPTSVDDPRPIDAEMGVVFNTGAQANTNSFNVNMRGISEAFLTQLDLDGKKMGELDKHPQPDTGISEFSTRHIGDLEDLDMSDLEKHTMQDLERVDNPVFDSWITFEMIWGNTNRIRLSNSSLPGYTLSIPDLAPFSYYIFICTLENTTARIRIYSLNKDFSINPKIIFDSLGINDSGLFPRRKGRLGWTAQLGDNDAFIRSIRSRHLTFSEYRSSPLSTITPVAGAQLFANITPNIQLWENLDEGPNNEIGNSTISRDSARSTTGNSYRIDIYGGANQGFKSNILNFTDFSQSVVSFDVWHPAGSPQLKARLLGAEGTSIPLTLPLIEPEQWQKVFISLSNELVHTGEYRFIIEQPSTGATSWWIDNISIYERAFQWSARSVTDDPWMSTYAPWTDFHDLINTNAGAIMFPIRGKELQIRAKALRQDSVIIDSPKVKPQYAELGRLVWPEDIPIPPRPPTANFTFTIPPVGIEPNFISVPDAGIFYLIADPTAIWMTDEVSLDVKKASLAGGSTSVVTSSKTPQAITSDGEYIYWANDLSISRRKISSGVEDKEFIVFPANSNIEETLVEGMAVDGTYLYFTYAINGGVEPFIARANKTTPSAEGGPNFKMIPSEQGVLDVKVQGSFLYWITENNLRRSRIDGKEETVIFGLPTTHLFKKFILTSTKIFWLQQNRVSAKEHVHSIGRARIDGGEFAPEIVSLGTTTTGLSYIGLAGNSEFLYWFHRETKKIERGTITELGNLVYEFVATATAGSAPISIYKWDFGDGATGVGETVRHKFPSHGTFPVTLIVTDRNGLQAKFTKSIVV